MDRVEARIPAVLTAIAVAALIVFLVAACSIRGSGESGGGEEGPAESAYAECLRENGAAPPADAEDFDPDGLAAAQAACADLLPEGAPEDRFGAPGGGFAPPGAGGSGGPSEAQIADLVECLRDQGLEVPDEPTELRGALDPTDPEIQSALGACIGGGPFGP